MHTKIRLDVPKSLDFNAMSSNCPKILFKPVSSYQFETREIPLNEPCKIGRAVGKIKPHKTNAIFDCKVLSRNHAMIWYENGKFYLRDTKSSNGTFANKRRLSEACEESEPYEIFSNDQIQFGVDVTDNLIVHPCIITQISVFHPDGKEAFHNSVNLSQRDLHKMSQILNEAKNRELALSQKQKQFSLLLEDVLNATSDSWKAMVDEESLLSKILVLETELEIYRKPLEEGDLKKQLLDLTSIKYEEEMFLKGKVNQIYEDKVRVEANVEYLQNQILEKVNENESINRMLLEANDEVENLTESKSYLQEELTNVQTHLEQLEAKYKETLEELDQKDEMLKSVDRDCLRQQIERLQAQLNCFKEPSSGSHQPIDVEEEGDLRETNVIKSPRLHYFEVHDLSSPERSCYTGRGTELIDPAIWFKDSDSTINPTFFSPLNDTSLIGQDKFASDVSSISTCSSISTLNRLSFTDGVTYFSPPTETESEYQNEILLDDRSEETSLGPQLKRCLAELNKKLDTQMATLDHLCMKRINDTSGKLVNCLNTTQTFMLREKINRNSKANAKKMRVSENDSPLINKLKAQLLEKEAVLKREAEMSRAKMQESENFKLLLSERQKLVNVKEKMISELKAQSEAIALRCDKFQQENETLKRKLSALTNNPQHIATNPEINIGDQTKIREQHENVATLSSANDKGKENAPAGSCLDPSQNPDVGRGLFGNEEEEELDRLSHNYQELAYQTKVKGTNESMMHDDSFAWQKFLLTEPYRFVNQFFTNTNNASNATTLAITLAILAFLAFIILNYQ